MLRLFHKAHYLVQHQRFPILRYEIRHNNPFQNQVLACVRLLKSILRFALSYRPLSVQTFLLLSYFFWWCWLLAPRGNWLARSLYPCFVKFVDIIHDTNNCFRKYTDYFVKNQRFHGKSRRKILFAMFLSKHFTIRYLRLYWRTIVKLR